MQTRVTLRPGDKGTKKLVREFGQKLICVRYRYDPIGRIRYKTVELVMALEEEFGIEIPDEDAEKMSSVGEAIKYIDSKTAGAK